MIAFLGFIVFLYLCWVAGKATAAYCRGEREGLLSGIIAAILAVLYIVKKK